MRRDHFIAGMLSVAALPALGQDEQDPLAEYRWVARPVILFADNPNDPRLVQQLREFAQGERDLDERDVVVIVDTEPGSALRRKLHPRDFVFVLVGKDGQVKYRKPRPVPVRELSRVIDKMPMRQQEIRSGS